jgi:hypothetical protein
MPKHVPPSITLKSFSCPRCGAHADQTWFQVFAHSINEEPYKPRVMTKERLEQFRAQMETERDPQQLEFIKSFLPTAERLASGFPLLDRRTNDKWVGFDLENIHVSQCYSCQQISIWLNDTILYPPSRFELEPNADLNPDIRADFDEARTVLDLSPRSAAALLRLCIQKIGIQLGLPGKNINDDIKALVAKGLDPRVQKALDLVRVIGNNAVHPGTLDLKDDRETAAKLFALVNRIADDMITHPKELDALYNEKVPEGAKAQIAKRDGVQATT